MLTLSRCLQPVALCLWSTIPVLSDLTTLYFCSSDDRHTPHKKPSWLCCKLYQPLWHASSTSEFAQPLSHFSFVLGGCAYHYVAFIWWLLVNSIREDQRFASKIRAEHPNLLPYCYLFTWSNIATSDHTAQPATPGGCAALAAATLARLSSKQPWSVEVCIINEALVIRP